MGEPGTPGAVVTVRYFAAARAAAGRGEEPIRVAVPATIADVLSAMIQAHGPGLAQVLRRCSYLLAETAVHGPDTRVTDGDVLDVLPPFAGG